MLSVIIPVYNVSQYLNACLDSVLNQCYKDIEVIIIDDGSTDDSGLICDEYSKLDSRIKVIHQQNRGLSAARNAGIENATGKFITFVDSDDKIAPDTFSENIRYFDSNVDIVEYPYYFKYGSDKSEAIFFDDKIVLGHNEILKNWNRNKCYEHSYACNKLFRRELFNGIYYPVNTFFEDIIIIPKLFWNAQSIAFSNRGLYYYYDRKTSITNTSSSDKLKTLYFSNIEWFEKLQNERIDNLLPFYIAILNIAIDIFLIRDTLTVYPNYRVKFKDIISSKLNFKELVKASFLAFFGIKIYLRTYKLFLKCR